jgi:3',5'-cyclic AMP phosphodiesterase CpdA
MHTYSILHVSDLHFGIQPNVTHVYDSRHERDGARRGLLHQSSHDPDLVEFVASTAYKLRRKNALDLVVITGDLATSGSDDDLSAAYTFVDRETNLGWINAEGDPSLDGQHQKLLLLPGNHDRYHGGIASMPGGRRFDAIFERYWTAGQGVEWLATLGNEGTSDRLAIVGMDCTLTTIADAEPAHSYFGQGRVKQELLSKLKNQLLEIRKSIGDTAVLLLLHYSPEHPRTPAHSKLIGDTALVGVAADLAVTDILCGHLHDAEVYDGSLGGVRMHSAGSASHCAVPENAFHVRRVTVDGSRITTVGRIDFVWNSELGDWTRSEH